MPRVEPSRHNGEGPLPPSHQNIEAILDLRARAAASISRHQRFLERATKALGRPTVVYVAVVAALAWMVCNALWPRLFPGTRAPDPPPFPGLELFVSLLAAIMTVTILTTQNRERQSAEDRGHLELQINLLSERKIAKLIALVEELRKDMPNVPDRTDVLANQMQEAVDPHAVLNALADAAETPEGTQEPREPKSLARG